MRIASEGRRIGDQPSVEGEPRRTLEVSHFGRLYPSRGGASECADVMPCDGATTVISGLVESAIPRAEFCHSPFGFVGSER